MRDDRLTGVGRRERPTLRGGPPPAPRRAPPLAAVGMALPCAITSVLASIPSLVALPTVGEGGPLAVLLVIVVQLCGLLLARELERPSWRRAWLLAVATTALLFPALAISTAAAREPFVSLTLGSAGTLLWTSAFTLAILLAVALLAAVQAIEEPQHAGIYFAPAALLVPAMIGAPGIFDERSALAALAEAAAVAAVAAAAAWLVPGGARLLVGPVALGAQFALLWALGYRPVFGAGHGAVAPVVTGFILAATIAATLLVPVAALRLRRLRRAVAAAQQRRDPRAP